MKKSNLSFGQLVALMHQILGECEYRAQRDARLDVAELAEAALAGVGFKRYWAPRIDGSHLSPSNDFGFWEPLLYGRYFITFHPSLGWSLERLPD